MCLIRASRISSSLSFIILVPFWCGASFKSIKCVYSKVHLWDHENDIVTKRVYFVTFFQSWNHKLPGAFKANLTKKIFAEPPLYSLLFGLMLRHLEISPIKFIFSEETFWKWLKNKNSQNFSYTSKNRFGIPNK